MSHTWPIAPPATTMAHNLSHGDHKSFSTCFKVQLEAESHVLSVAKMLEPESGTTTPNPLPQKGAGLLEHSQLTGGSGNESIWVQRRSWWQACFRFLLFLGPA